MATGAIIAATVISAAGAIYQGQQQKATADYNAKVSEMEADREHEEMLEQTRRTRKFNEELINKQRTVFGAAGVLESEGTPLEQLAETSARQELAILDQQRLSFIKQDQLNIQAEQYRISGRAAQTAGFMSAAATGLSGGAQAYTSYQETKARKADAKAKAAKNTNTQNATV